MTSKIVFIETKPSVYGGQKALLARCKALDGMCIAYTIVHPFAESRFLKEVEDLSLGGLIERPAHNINSRFGRIFFIFLTLWRVLSVKTPIIIHADAFDSAYLSILFRWMTRSNAEIVFTIRSDRYHRFKWYDKLLLRRVGKILTNSDYSKRLISLNGGIPESVIDVCYSPIEFEHFAKSRRDLGRSLTIGFVGSFEPRKRIDRFISAAARLSVQYDGEQIFFKIYGDVKGKDSVKFRAGIVEMIEGFGISAQTEMAGYRPLIHIAKEVDILYCPFEKEPLGRVVPEFLFCGIPVIVVDDGGLPEAGCGFAEVLNSASDLQLELEFCEVVSAIVDNRRKENDLSTVRRVLLDRYSPDRIVGCEMRAYNLDV